MVRLDDEIKAYCTRHRLLFKPWETKPWEATADQSPWPVGTSGHATWPVARALRKKIIAELKAETTRPK
jgi:hypothetical protein